MTWIFKKAVIFAFLVGALFSATTNATTRTAATCSSIDVQSAINSAVNGDTVMVPACAMTSWTSVTLNKAITLQGAGKATSGTRCPLAGTTNISFGSAAGILNITKQAAGPIRIQGFNFDAEGGGSNYPIVVQGAWQGTQPVLFYNDSFCGNNSNMGHIIPAGGVIFSHNYNVGTWNNGAVWNVSDDSNLYNSWRTNDSIGVNDTNGILNLYFEDNTYYGSTNAFIDCDSGCRAVVRHNTFQYASFNSHGYDTSPYGMRHFEIYNNTFSWLGNVNDQQGQALGNANWEAWIRGGTGVIFNNVFYDDSTTGWGTKDVVRFSMFALSNPSLLSGSDPAQATCTTISYPIAGNAGQIGQNWNIGSGFFTDPVYMWGNTNTSGGGTWTLAWGFDSGSAQTCSPNLTLKNWMQSGRDVSNTAVSGGSAKPGYTPYTYPHPLVQGGRTPPTNLVATPQ